MEDTAVAELVRRICNRVRLQRFDDQVLQQVCYEEFVSGHPPHPMPNPGNGSHVLGPESNEREGQELPSGRHFFMGGVKVTYSHTTELPWAIAGELARLVREQLRREPLQMAHQEA